jgi:hypothetical protein
MSHSFKASFLSFFVIAQAEKKETRLVPDPVRPTDYHAKTVNSTSELTGWRIKGKWTRKLRISHPFVEEMDSIEDENCQDLGIANHSKNIDTQLCAGKMSPYAKEFQYQIILR